MLLNNPKKNHHLNVVEGFVSPTILGTAASVPSGLSDGRVVSGYGPVGGVANEHLVAGAWPKRSTWSPVPVSLTPAGKGVEILLTVTWMADDGKDVDRLTLGSAVYCFAVEHNRLDIVGLNLALAFEPSPQ